MSGDYFEDERGTILDWFGPVDQVTRIHTVRGAVRGNHVHERTTQWTLVLSGRLLVSNGKTSMILGPKGMLCHRPGEPHAWEALEDTDCLVFTRGPRSGEGYESDTVKLEVPLL